MLTFMSSLYFKSLAPTDNCIIHIGRDTRVDNPDANNSDNYTIKCRLLPKGQ